MWPIQRTACHSRISTNKKKKSQKLSIKKIFFTSFRVFRICPKHGNFQNIENSLHFGLFYSIKYKRFAVNSVDPLFFAPLLPIEAAVNRRFAEEEEDECIQFELAGLHRVFIHPPPERARKKNLTPFYVHIKKGKDIKNQ